MKYDVVIIGGGLAGITAGIELQKNGKRTVVVAFGLSMHETPRSEYVALGGTILPGDRVISGKFKDDVLKSVTTLKLGNTSLEAPAFILCTGKFFSKGLVATMDKIYEPVFGCDVKYNPDRSKWVRKNFSDEQPFMSYGLKTGVNGNVFIAGKKIKNLYAAGEIVYGSDIDIKESALAVCRNLI